MKIVRCKKCYKAVIRTASGDWEHTGDHTPEPETEPEERVEQATANPGEKR